MPGNSFGHTLVLTTFGESHGAATGGILDGFPSLIDIDLDFIQSEVNRRRTGQAFFSSSRKEDDQFEILSGVFEGKSTGAPIAFITRNIDAKPEHYDQIKNVYRPSHADYTWEKKFGIRDYHGGGRASARETLARVIGGALAKLLLKKHGIFITGYVSQIGPCHLDDAFVLQEIAIPRSKIGCPDPQTEAGMIKILEDVKQDGDTLGGVISCTIKGVPAGLGEPVFDKLSADLAKALLSIPSVKGFEYGSGFSSASMKGSEHNDVFISSEQGTITTKTNHSGGIQGGISNGNEIYFRVAFKPVSSLMKDQETINRQGEQVVLKGKGRHDVCVVPRAIVIVEAMASLVLADHLLRHRSAVA